jgi:hypothetical protein
MHNITHCVLKSTHCVLIFQGFLLMGINPPSGYHRLMKNLGRHLLIALAAALAVGALFWFQREQRVSECRRAAMAANISVPQLSGDPQAVESAIEAIALARQLNAEKARSCYLEGYLTSPRG